MELVLLSKQNIGRVSSFILSRLIPCREVGNLHCHLLVVFVGITDSLAQRGAMHICSEGRLVVSYSALVKATRLRFD